MDTRSFFPTEIEFNITGNYGSPIHVNHNANYSSMPSPDMDPADRRQPEQARRPLSVATDNMMLEFYKKDGYEPLTLSQPWGVKEGGVGWWQNTSLTGRLHLIAKGFGCFVGITLLPPSCVFPPLLFGMSLDLLPSLWGRDNKRSLMGWQLWSVLTSSHQQGKLK